MGIKLGILGVGAFAQSFIPVFKEHPGVDSVLLCDQDTEKLKANLEKHDIRQSCSSLEQLLESDVDSIAIFTQNDRHGPQAIAALRAGKNVYSAVPSTASIEEMRGLVQAVEDSGKVYMIGETSYYYPSTLFCREKYRRGDFGHVVYSEGEYYHDYDHGLVGVLQHRYGDRWREYGNWPPMYYPTHSVSMVVSVTGAHVERVSCMGFCDRHEDGLFTRGEKVYANTFSNQTMLCQMSDGSMARFNEFRRIGHPGTVGMSMYGTEASYEEQVGGVMWSNKDRRERVDLGEFLSCRRIPDEEIPESMKGISGNDGTHDGFSRIHPVDRLPQALRGKGSGHSGSHAFLVDDYVVACIENIIPVNNVWDAARYLIPGLIAHESSMQNGKLMEVPDFGDAPESLGRLRRA